MIPRRKLAFLFIVITAVQSENPTENPEKVKGDRGDFKKSLSRDCASKYTITCLKFDIVSWVDKLNEEDNYDVLPGVSVIRENGTARANTADMVAELARDFPNDVEARLDAFLIKKVSGYLNTHSIKLKLFGNEDDLANQGTARGGGGGGGFGGGGGGGGKKGGGMGGVLLAGAAMMKATLMALALGALAALAGKALMTGLISLMLSTIIGLKSLTHGGGKTTYEVIAKPIYSHANTHSVSHEDHHAHGGYSSYGRSFDDAPLPLGLHPEYKP